MYYLIDGYNFLFSLADSKQLLSSQRAEMILFLKKKFSYLQLHGSLIFDGKRQKGEESGLSYPSPLEVVYTDNTQTADAYIIEKLEGNQYKNPYTVVSNDRYLVSTCRSLGAKSTSNIEFVQWLHKKTNRKKNIPKVEISETKQNIDRLLKLFEKKLKNKKKDDI